MIKISNFQQSILDLAVLHLAKFLLKVLCNFLGRCSLLATQFVAWDFLELISKHIFRTISYTVIQYRIVCDSDKIRIFFTRLKSWVRPFSQLASGALELDDFMTAYIGITFSRFIIVHHLTFCSSSHLFRKHLLKSTFLHRICLSCFVILYFVVPYSADDVTSAPKHIPPIDTDGGAHRDSMTTQEESPAQARVCIQRPWTGSFQTASRNTEIALMTVTSTQFAAMVETNDVWLGLCETWQWHCRSEQ